MTSSRRRQLSFTKIVDQVAVFNRPLWVTGREWRGTGCRRAASFGVIIRKGQQALIPMCTICTDAWLNGECCDDSKGVEVAQMLSDQLCDCCIVTDNHRHQHG